MILSYLNFAAFIIYLFFAFYIYIHRQRDEARIAFIFVILAFADWAFWDFLAQSHRTDIGNIQWFYGLGALGWVFFGPFLLIFCATFARRQWFLKKSSLFFLFFPGVVLILAQWSGALVVGAVTTPYGRNGVWAPNLFTILFYAYYSFASLAGLGFLLFLPGHSVRDTRRKHARYLFFVVTLMLLFGGVTELFIPTFFYASFPNMGQLALLPALPFMVYAVERLDLFSLTPRNVSFAIFNSMHDSVFILDGEGAVTRVNPAALRLLGKTKEKVLGRAFLTFVRIETKEGATEKIRDGAYSASLVMPDSISSATARLHVSITSLRNRRRIYGYLCLIRDMSRYQDELAHYEDARARAQSANNELQSLLEVKDTLAKQAQAANEAKNTFLANMSHEIRTPLNGIVGGAQLLALSPLSQVQREYLEVIESSSDLLVGLIEEVMDLSTLQAGAFTVKSGYFSPLELSRTMITVFRPQFEASAVNLALEVQEEELPLEIPGDPLRVSQILLNFLGNAVKFTSRGEVILRVTCAEGRVRFAVMDSGKGIEEDSVAALFEQYKQVEIQDAQIGGAGLGLHISKSLVERMGGSIGAETNDYGGATFWFELPSRERKQNE